MLAVLITGRSCAAQALLPGIPPCGAGGGIATGWQPPEPGKQPAAPMASLEGCVEVLQMQGPSPALPWAG